MREISELRLLEAEFVQRLNNSGADCDLTRRPQGTGYDIQGLLTGNEAQFSRAGA